ncbi:MAG: VWA domain-containing protein, partial [Terriglobales bacterium]
LYLHLLRRQTTNPRPFSSLMFFEPRTQASMRHRRLRYLWLLALRLALLALLVLAFADPFILRPAASVTSQRLTLLVVDHSFSMRAGDRLAQAKSAALDRLAAASGRVQVLALGSRLDVLTQPTSDHAALRAAIAGIQPGDERADFATLARGMRSLGAATPVELDLYSDLKQSSMPASFADLQLPANVALALHPAGTVPAPNWTIASLQAPSQVWGSPKETKPARVEATVTGFETPAATLNVSLLVNGAVIASQHVAVPASGSARVVFDTLAPPYGWTRGQLRLDMAAGTRDALAADNIADFAIERADPARVLFVHSAGDARSPLYFSAALGSTAASNRADAAFTMESVSAAAAAGRPLANYAFVVLSDLPAVPPAFESALGSYIRGGGGVLLATGAAAQSLPLWGAAIAASENLAQRPLTVGVSDASHPSTALLADWPNVHFYFADRIAPGDARVLARLSDQTPILMDKKIGEGHLELFASGLDNLTNDFPLDPGFVAFVRETARYLAGDAADPASSRLVDQYLALRTAKESGVGVEVADPSGRRPLSLAQAASAQTLQLDQAGFYQLRLANGRQQLVAVNPDRRESDLAPISDEDLALWRGGGNRPQPQTAGMTAPSAQEIQVDLWWYVMLVLLAAALVESVVAARYMAVRRDQEAAMPAQLKEVS